MLPVDLFLHTLCVVWMQLWRQKNWLTTPPSTSLKEAAIALWSCLSTPWQKTVIWGSSSSNEHTVLLPYILRIQWIAVLIDHRTGKTTFDQSRVFSSVFQYIDSYYNTSENKLAGLVLGRHEGDFVCNSLLPLGLVWLCFLFSSCTVWRCITCIIINPAQTVKHRLCGFGLCKLLLPKHTPLFKSLGSLTHFCTEVHHNQLHETIHWNALRTLLVDKSQSGCAEHMGCLWELLAWMSNWM